MRVQCCRPGLCPSDERTNHSLEALRIGKSLTEKNVNMYYIRVREGKNEKLKKEDKMSISILISIYSVHFAFLKVYTKFENTGSNRS